MLTLPDGIAKFGINWGRFREEGSLTSRGVFLQEKERCLFNPRVVEESGVHWCFEQGHVMRVSVAVALLVFVVSSVSGADDLVPSQVVRTAAYFGSSTTLRVESGVRVSDRGALRLVSSGDVRLSSGFSVDIGGELAVQTGVVDTDSDGLPDQWEVEHFGNIAASIGGASDSDADGDTDFAEYVAGSDPTSSGSRVVQIATSEVSGRLALPVEGESIRITVITLGLVAGDTLKLYDRFGNDITANAYVSGNGLELVLDPDDALGGTGNERLAGSTQAFRIAIERNGTDLVSQVIDFVIDGTPPTVVAREAPGGELSNRVETGRYDQPVDVVLEFDPLESGGQILYSDDGTYPNQPYQSAIHVDETMVLRYRSFDAAGNEGSLESVLFEFDDLPSPVAQVSAQLAGGDVAVSWQDLPAPHSYRVYGARSAYDRLLLQQSTKSKVPPPAHLRIGSGSIAQGVGILVDATPPSEVPLQYVVTAVSPAGFEGKPSAVAEVTVPNPTVPSTTGDAIAAASGFLEASQMEDGGWPGEMLADRIIATAQVLQGLKQHSTWVEDHPIAVERGIGFLRGRFVDDNDAIARSILALRGLGTPVRDLEVRLAFRAFDSDADQQSSDNQVDGWSVHRRYYPDALHTALGYRVAAAWPAQAGLPTASPAVDKLTNAAGLLKAIDFTQSTSVVPVDRFGWVPRNRDSVYVSALVYDTVGWNTDPGKYSWILALGQDPESGLYRDSVLDTAAVLRWIPLSQQDRVAVEAAVVGALQTDPVNGSWQNDAFLTGFCLEALLHSAAQQP